MPKSPKVFRAGPLPSPLLSRCRRISSSSSAFSLFCLIFGLAGFLFGAISISRPARSCPGLEPRSVSVVWDRGGAAGSGTPERHKVMAFVGIQTGFGSVGRRRSIRQTWLPSDRPGLLRSVLVSFLGSIRLCNPEVKMVELHKREICSGGLTSSDR
ncbi:hypothetical protein B296_00035183 [Ensete ventricosum]|uniref:Uncharacterized protein n=1 Tax=Ensete ventricosum TaxID=4639 RepID=A0A426ZL37_ENSVE|nr:hypothetical protein B296_00035183 [Ensete ventricosum]